MIGKLKSPNCPSVSYHNIKIQNNQVSCRLYLILPLFDIHYFINIRGVKSGSIAYGDGIVFFGCENVVIDNNSLSAAPGRTPR